MRGQRRLALGTHLASSAAVLEKFRDRRNMSLDWLDGVDDVVRVGVGPVRAWRAPGQLPRDAQARIIPDNPPDAERR
jgi:hypothetical protein